MTTEVQPGALGIVAPVWRHLYPDHNPGEAELYQTSLMAALLKGIYEGEVTYGDLRKHGDFGLGTFNDLDGEMVGFDGAFFQLRSDGSARPVEPTQKTPFAIVTFFRPELKLSLDKRLSKSALTSLIERASNPNVFTAIKIDGVFLEVKTRTVQRQQMPFPPLTEAAAHQAVNTLKDVRGTLAGFRSPDYAQGIGVAGFHLHFITADRQSGGHALDYQMASGTIQLAPQRGFHVELPDSAAFRDAALGGDDNSAQIKAAEGE